MVLGAYNPSYSGRLRQENCLNPEAEVAVSRDHTTALQPGDRVRLCLNKQKHILGRAHRLLHRGPVTPKRLKIPSHDS